jgi:pimeloyl-ACP methyl ester carboxylesterase
MERSPAPLLQNRVDRRRWARVSGSLVTIGALEGSIMNISRIRSPSPATRRTALLAGSAAVAAATALWVKYKAGKAERENPPIGQFVEVDGVRLHYVERGEGPPVVLLHGNAVLLQDFLASGLIDSLAQEHRVIAFDRPGFGFSERPRDRLWTPTAQAALVERALTQLGIERAVVLGHSWGTLVALALALDHPEKVRGLLLASGYYYPTARLDALMTAPVALPVLGDVMRYTVSPVFGRMVFGKMVKAMFAPRAVPAQFSEVLSREMMLRPGQIGANAEDAAFMVPAAAQFQSRYQELGLPIEIFAGEEDLVVDVDAHSTRLHGELPQSRLTVVPETGHMVHYAVPGQMVKAIAGMSGDPVQKPRMESA